MTQPTALTAAAQAAFKSFATLLERYEASPDNLVAIYDDVSQPIVDRAHRREFSIGVIDLLHKLGPRDEATAPIVVKLLYRDINTHPGLVQELSGALHAGAKAVLACLPQQAEAQTSPNRHYIERLLAMTADLKPSAPVACAYTGHKGGPRV